MKKKLFFAILFIVLHLNLNGAQITSSTQCLVNLDYLELDSLHDYIRARHELFVSYIVKKDDKVNCDLTNQEKKKYENLSEKAKECFKSLEQLLSKKLTYDDFATKNSKLKKDLSLAYELQINHQISTYIYDEEKRRL